MPLRGESVGTAYVRILADGSDLPDSIKDEIRDTDKVWDEQGKINSDAYKQAFVKEFRKTALPEMNRALEEGLGRGDAINKAFSQKKFRNFVDRLKKDFGDAGIVFASELQNSIEKGGSFDALLPRLRNVQHEIDVIRARIAKATEKEAEGVKSTGVEIGRTGSRLRSFVRGLDTFDRRLDHVADTTARAFGKGSRNNALNFFGGVIGGSVRLIGLVPRMVKGFLETGQAVKGFFQQFAVGFNLAEGGGLNKFVAGLRSGGGALSGIAKSGPAAVVAIAVLIAILGPLAALLSGVAAAATALAASLGFALVGAIAPLVGLMAPLVFAVGTLTLAFSGLSKQAKKTLANDLKPLTKEMKGLQAVAQKGLLGNIDEQAKDLAPVMRALRPVIRDVSRSLSRFFDTFIEGLNTPGFKRFLASMDKFLPVAIDKLGHIFTNFFLGVSGLFVALEPITLRFLRWLEGISANFAQFTNSGSGQNALRDFFKRAGDSAHDVLDLLGSIGGLIATIANPGKGAGDNIIESLTQSVDDFNDFLKENPKALSDWFKHGKEIAGQIGDIVVEVGKMFDALDSPESRDQIKALLTVLKVTFGAISLILTGITQPVNIVTDAIDSIGKHWTGILNVVKIALLTLKLYALNFAEGFLNAMVAAFGWVPGLGKELKGARDKVHQWVLDVNHDIDNIRDHFEIKGSLKINLDAIGGAALSRQARNKLIEMAIDRAREFGGPVRKGLGYLVGENGPEWFQPEQNGRIVPNNDPAVQAMLVHGHTTTNTSAVSRDRNIDASGWTIVSPTEDPRAVASEVVNQLAATALI